ncbi:cobalt ECF transporter T component CbiQ [Pararhodobacter marinus]|uniref:Cobalt ECF transporter T component CbiQ n=1 Tax=Pararhodobacter marinus TaxID=2184063 RepID=A0A2U2CD04_9RHOB|nr:cobalt ECF transporter T component CbiQ [Pararhodobacter marinus]PWE29763.1 cobalt ECF transporter T component CbiQ [Pararhodobacter marinus]
MAHILSPRRAALAQGDEGAGWLDRIDPRSRILGASLFAVAVVACSRLEVLGLAFACSLALLLAARLPIRPTLKRMAAMDGFILFMLVLLPFTVPGEAIVTLWGFTASWQGLARAVEIALTANAVVLALMVLVGTMEPVTLGHALHALKMPERLVHLLMFSIRYIGTLREEYLRLRVAMKIRGFRPRTNWHTYRSYGYLVGMMLVRAVERSERILGAMKCRGFSGRITMLHSFRLTRADLAFGAGLCGTLAVLLLLEFGPWP